MLRRALLPSLRRRRPRAAAAIADAAPATATVVGGVQPRQLPLMGHLLLPRRAIGSTAWRARQAPPAPGGKDGQQTSLVPPATWSIHDLQVLKEDAGAGQHQQGQQEQEQGLSQEELTRLAGYAHVDVGPESKLDRGQLQEDLDAIIRCMTLLQKADLEGVSREEMYAPPPHAAPATPLRDDAVTEGGPEQQRQLLGLSGETARQQYVVPTVVDKGK